MTKEQMNETEQDRGAASATLAPAIEGTLILDSKPEGCEVYDGNDLKGRTPLELRLTPGFHPLHLMREGYASQYLQVEIQAGRVLRRTVALEGDWAVLAFDLAEEASVYLDGDFLISLPSSATNRVSPGAHKIVIEAKAGKARREIAPDLVPGAVLTVNKDTK